MRSICMALSLLLSANVALAEAGRTNSVACSNANGSVKISFYGKEGESAQQDKIEYRALSLMGPQIITMKSTDVNLVEGQRVILGQKENSTNTICDIPSKTVSKEYAVEVRISKKDGTVIHEDDTPDTVVREIKTKVICSSSVTDPWPCP